MDFEDDGDYATLRMGAVNGINREDTVSEENKVRKTPKIKLRSIQVVKLLIIFNQ